jgi:hypothetical protein
VVTNLSHDAPNSHTIAADEASLRCVAAVAALPVGRLSQPQARQRCREVFCIPVVFVSQLQGVHLDCMNALYFNVFLFVMGIVGVFC